MNVDTDRKAAQEQAMFWNGVAGCAWVDLQQLLDEVLKPFEDLLVEFVTAAPAGCVLDVGCGTGATTLAVARSLGAPLRCVGIDISEPMIAVARARAGRERASAAFIVDDAETHVFEPAIFDAIISRFGVMFFDDSVRAFANLRYAARSGARLRFVAWRDPAENPFLTTAERAAAPLLPDMPTRQPDAPGQFAFADRSRVHRILEESGWTGIDIRPIDIACTFAEKYLTSYVTRMGPLGRALDQADERTRRQIIEIVRAAFDPFVQGAKVRFDAACWVVSARAAESREKQRA
jgi:SAM-dependent methyltransferase